MSFLDSLMEKQAEASAKMILDAIEKQLTAKKQEASLPYLMTALAKEAAARAPHE
jgi:hypothetical protein